MTNRTNELDHEILKGTSIFMCVWIPIALTATANRTSRYVRLALKKRLIRAALFVGMSCSNFGSYSAIADDSPSFGKHKLERLNIFTAEEIEKLGSDEIIVQFNNEKRTLTEGVQQRLQLLSKMPFKGDLCDFSVPANNQPVVSWGYGTTNRMGVAEVNRYGKWNPLVPLNYVSRGRSENLLPGRFYDDLTRGNFWHYTGDSAVNAKGEIFLTLGKCDPNAIVKYIPRTEDNYGQNNNNGYGQESSSKSIARGSGSGSPGYSPDEQRAGRFQPMLEIDGSHDMDIYKFDPEAIYVSLYYQIYRYEFPEDGGFVATNHLTIRGKTQEFVIDFEAVTPDRWIVNLHDPKKPIKLSYRTILLDLTTNTFHELREFRNHMVMGTDNNGNLMCRHLGEMRTYRLLATSK